MSGRKSKTTLVEAGYDGENVGDLFEASVFLFLAHELHVRICGLDVARLEMLAELALNPVPMGLHVIADLGDRIRQNGRLRAIVPLRRVPTLSFIPTS